LKTVQVNKGIHLNVTRIKQDKLREQLQLIMLK